MSLNRVCELGVKWVIHCGNWPGKVAPVTLWLFSHVDYEQI